MFIITLKLVKYEKDDSVSIDVCSCLRNGGM